MNKYLNRQLKKWGETKLFKKTVKNFSDTGKLDDKSDQDSGKKVFSGKYFFSNFEHKKTYSDYNKNSNEKKPIFKSAASSILQSKQINLTKVYYKDLIYFKLEENFMLTDLKKKYLQLAKLYHPDIRVNDRSASIQFNKLQHSYERLKIYHSLRDELMKLEEDLKIGAKGMTEDQKKKIDEINEESFKSMDMEAVLDKENMTRDEFINQLLIEDEFGDIKEPKYAVQILLVIWFMIGLIVFYLDIRKYCHKLQKRREGVDYSYL